MVAGGPTGRSRRADAEARRARRAEVDDPDIVMSAAAAYLAVRPRSVKETRGRLAHLGYPAALCDTVVERLVAIGYLDDEAFARAWVESRDRARPRGRLALRRELQTKGVAEAVIAAVLDERDALADAAQDDTDAASPLPAGSRGADTAAARSLLERRAASLAREPDPRRRRQRAYALLAGRGFTPDVCRDVAAAFLSMEGDPSTDEAV